MATVHVIRSLVDENNNLVWATFEIDEAELLPGEATIEQQQAAMADSHQEFVAPDPAPAEPAP